MNYSTETRLMDASIFGDIDLVMYLVEERLANIHVDGDSPIKYASELGYTDIVKYLVEKGADIKTFGEECIRKAGSNGHFEVVLYLFKQGVNINKINKVEKL